ncbi:MAG TPA: undecaprenyl-diphosphate phosphatase [Candidatus Magasanikbacteria bacterium]|nr:undecaprenyl-diphosphate phosphatase [Candidatus Magasanikbacteria bacterium]
MSYFHAIIIAVVEGITEFLPISSTGHMILTADLLKLEYSKFLSTFEISIQLGAILAVIYLYWKKLFIGIEIWKKIIVAFLPSAILGFTFYPMIKKMLEGNTVVLWSLFLGGIVLIIFELWYKERETDISEVENISYKQSFIVGLYQCIAMIPGVSRSAATIIGGLTQRMKRKTIIEFSFLLAIPTMGAATGYDLLKNASAFNIDQLLLLFTGFIISFFVAIISIKFLLSLVKKYTFIGFGVYRIIIAIVFWFFIS